MKKKQQNKKVGLVACYLTGYDAPWDDETFDFWTLNHGNKIYRDHRIDKWFDLHDWRAADYYPNYLSYVPEDPPYEVINADNFPYTEVMARYGCQWENSIPMILAYAGYLNYKHIYLFGAESREFINTPKMAFNLYHTIGMLRAENRKVYLVNQYLLDDSGVYGIRDDLKAPYLPAGFHRKEAGHEV